MNKVCSSFEPSKTVNALREQVDAALPCEIFDAIPFNNGGAKASDDAGGISSDTAGCVARWSVAQATEQLSSLDSCKYLNSSRVMHSLW